MSQCNELKANMTRLARACRGSHYTHRARQNTVSSFVAFVVASGFTHMRDAHHIAARHVREYVQWRLDDDIQIRTLHNELSHLRSILKAGRCHAVADAPQLSNKALGLAGASRKGTKIALSPEDYERVRCLAFSRDRPGMAAIIRLQQAIGLRINEALHARTDTLERWMAELARVGRITVIAGTKGGRQRTVNIFDREEVLAALKEAHDVACAQDSFLVTRANGKSSGGLKQALSITRNWMIRAKIQSHSARYAFAQAQFEEYRKLGFSEREARIAVSLDLGHGDGRGRWVSSVYGQKPGAENMVPGKMGDIPKR